MASLLSVRRSGLRTVMVGSVCMVALLSLGVMGPASSSAMPARERVVIGTGDRTCVLKDGADCREVVHRNAQFRGSLAGARFVRAKLPRADFAGVNLSRADLRGVILKGAYLKGANLRRADLGPVRTKVAPRSTPSCSPNCQGADLTGADLSNANLFTANLSYANLTRADLSRANIFAADLSYANLTSADLTYANLAGADLSYTNLTGADLAHVNVTGATWNNTRCPDGTIVTGVACPHAPQN